MLGLARLGSPGNTSLTDADNDYAAVSREFSLPHRSSLQVTPPVVVVVIPDTLCTF